MPVKTIAAINDWDALAVLLREVGPLVTVPCAAAALGVSKVWAYKLVGQGRLRCYAVMGLCHVPASDVDALLQRRFTSGQLSGVPDEVQSFAV
jgi:hypothetical protein